MILLKVFCRTSFLLLSLLTIDGFEIRSHRIGFQRRTLVLPPLHLSDDKQRAQIRFSGTGEVDSVLSLLTSDIGSIALGMIGLLLLLVGRLALDDPSSIIDTSSTRANLLAVLACGAVLVNGISKLDVKSALAEKVVLEGVQRTVSDDSFEWIVESCLAATPAATCAVLQSTGTAGSWELATAAGTVPVEPFVPPSTPILDRFRAGTQQETYLPTLQALPGKTEFQYLPKNTQAVLMVPISNKDDATTVLVLAADQARSFTPRDIAWCLAAAVRLGKEL